ncbi:MAG: hypothetical protein ACRED3_14550, partial [Bradyrhizobium sp.]
MPLKLIVASGVMSTSLGAIAQPIDATGIDYNLRATGLRIDKALLAGPLADAAPTVRLDQPATHVQQRGEISLIGSTVMLEMGRMTPDGKFVRPRLSIGQQSQELRSWMRSLGVQPERCMLPHIRGKLKRSE